MKASILIGGSSDPKHVLFNEDREIEINLALAKGMAVGDYIYVHIDGEPEDVAIQVHSRHIDMTENTFTISCSIVE